MGITTLSDQQRHLQKSIKVFVDEEVIPNANHFDKSERIPADFIAQLARNGYLGAMLPKEYGGLGMDYITYGLLNEELGRGCASVRSLVMLQNMVGLTLFKWGSDAQKEQHLKNIATGRTIAAFALSEPEIGSDAMNIQSSLEVQNGDCFVLKGHKKWISLGQIADLFLVFAQNDGKLCAALVEKDTPGLSLTPISGMLGVKASMLAEMQLDNCLVPQKNLVGRVGFGFVPVGLTALNLGRYSIAWGCVGLAKACLEASLEHTSSRKQFGEPLKKHQLIQKIITNMAVTMKAARLMCWQAGELQQEGNSGAIMEIMEAKYFSSKMALQAANDAIQVHGAIGCSSDSVVGRHFRDAKIMEIIEGTSQIHEIKIAEYLSCQ